MDIFNLPACQTLCHAKPAALRLSEPRTQGLYRAWFACRAKVCICL